MKHFSFFLVLFITFGSVQTVFSQSATAHISKAKRAYKRSQYADACFESIKALKIKPKKKKAQKILSMSYEMAVESINEQIDDLKSESEFFQDDFTVTQRKEIVKLYMTIRKLDKKSYEISKIVKSSKYDIDFERIDVKEDLAQAKKSLLEAKQDAAEQHYSNGLKFNNIGDRENYKKAAKEFKKAKTFIPNYKESEKFYAEARKNGTTRIAIFAFDNKTGTTQFGGIGESVSDQLSAKLFNDSEAMEFAEIISRDELGKLVTEHNLNMTPDMDPNTASEYGKLMGVHVIITGKITQVSAEHQPIIDDAARTVSRNVVVGKESYVNSKGKTRTRSVYGDVYAQVFDHRKTSKAILSGSYKVLDVKTGKILSQDQFSETYVWENKWITYTGDGKAINGIPRGYDSNELNPPTNFEMGNFLVNSLTEKMALKIKNLLN